MSHVTSLWLVEGHISLLWLVLGLSSCAQRHFGLRVLMLSVCPLEIGYQLVIKPEFQLATFNFGVHWNSLWIFSQINTKCWKLQNILLFCCVVPSPSAVHTALSQCQLATYVTVNKNQMKNDGTQSKNDAGYAGLAFSQEEKSRLYFERLHYSNPPLI